jgi:ribokinase
VAAARAGAPVRFLTRLGRDPFAAMARAMWAEAGVTPEVHEDESHATGAAFIFLDAATRDNAIIVCPGAAAAIDERDIEGWRPVIETAAVFVTQLESPLPASLRALAIARAAGCRTVLNPAPAAPLPDGMLALCDIVTPNESEAEAITGIAIRNLDDAGRAAHRLIEAGAGAGIVTLGAQGALYADRTGRMVHVPAMPAGPVAETTGAGDAFNGALAAALARGADPVEAVRFGCAAAGISVTRRGAAASMATRAEIMANLARAR